MARKPTDRTPEEILFLLSSSGWALAEVDRNFGLPEGTASKACGYPHFAGELAIAEALGLSPREIWPSRYDTSGARLKPQPAQNYKARRRARHGQKRKAA